MAITLRGHPAALEALLPGATWAEATTVPQVKLEAPGGERALAAYVTLPGSVSLVGLRVVLPDDTPPGSYGGTVVLGDREVELELEVEGRRGLTLLPGEISVSGSSKAQLTAINTGNVAVTIPERDGVGLFASRGLDRALGRAFTAKAERGLERFDVLGAALSDEHGGVLILRVVDGAGPLEPGDTRRLAIELDAPGGARQGDDYFGFWRVAGTSVPVRLNLGEAEEPR